ncbi:MAG: hypothetical protein KAR32_10680 [Candidatus Omnitrophica bacterium]|nr:hypothetical protein [Candidatus Omnitrophota bacterium]
MSILYNMTASSFNMIFYILVSFGFVVGIILMVAPTAYESLNDALQKEYGIKKRFIPKIEDTKIEAIDSICKKNTVITGMIISVVSFMLLLIFK